MSNHIHTKYFNNKVFYSSVLDGMNAAGFLISKPRSVYIPARTVGHAWLQVGNAMRHCMIEEGVSEKAAIEAKKQAAIKQDKAEGHRA